MTEENPVITSADVANVFAMYGARGAVAGGWLHIERQVGAIERATADNPSFAFDLAKTIVESACKTILDERHLVFGSDDDLPKLFKLATKALPMLPPDAHSEAHARKSLAQTLNGLHTALQGVCELRNAYGFASHGSGEERPAMETGQALLAAQAADAIVGFLFRVHSQSRLVAASPEPEFDDHEAFNTFVDDLNDPVRIFELEYRPSEVLYGIDRQAYLDILAGFGAEPLEDGSASSEDVVRASK